MKRLWIFVLVLGVALLVLAIVISWYILVFEAGRNATMVNMMGGQYFDVVNPMPTYIWVSMIAVIAVLVAGAIVVAYYLAYPEIRQAAAVDRSEVDKNPSDSDTVDRVIPQSNLASNSTAPPSKESWLTLLRTSRPEEKRVLEVLSAHGGVYLQKLIVKETGLSKLKTHRIISRFAERGIVNVTKTGNTNEVRLSSWVKCQSFQTTEKPTKTE